jgi:hypothetical protein
MMTDAAYQDPQSGTFGGVPQQQQKPPSPQQGQQSPQPGQGPGPQGPAQQLDQNFDLSGPVTPPMTLPMQMQPRGMMPAFQRHGLQQFIPAFGNRSPQMWGRPRDFPMVPKHWEVPGILRGIGQQMAQYGSAYTAPLGAALGAHTGAWMKGYMQGQEARARMLAEQMRNTSMALQLQMEKELDTYGGIFATYGDDPKNHDKLEAALRNAAATDPRMQAALNTDGVAGAQRLVQWMDAKHSDLRVTNKAHQHEQDVKDAEAPYKVGPQHQTDAAGLPVTTPTPRTAPASPPTSSLVPATEGAPVPGLEDQGGGGAAGGDTGGAAAGGDTGEGAAASDGGGGEIAQGDAAPDGDGGDQQAGDQQQQQPPVQLAQNDGVTSDAPQPGAQRLAQQDQQQQPTAQQQPGPRQLPDTPALSAAKQQSFDPADIDNLAQQMLLGQFKMSEYKNQDNRVRLAQQRAQELRGEVANITSNPKLDTPEKVYAEIDKRLGRNIGDDVRGLVAGRLTIGRGASSAKPPFDTLLALGGKADPGLDSQTVMTRARARNYFNAGAGLQQKIKLGTAYTHGQALLDKLQNQPQVMEAIRAGAGFLPKAVRDRMFPETSAYIAAMEADIQAFTSETNSVLAYGPGSKGERESLKADIDWSQPNEAMARVQDYMSRLRDREDHLRTEYEKNTGLKDWDSDISGPPGQSTSPHPRPAAPGSSPDNAVDYRTFFGGQ